MKKLSTLLMSAVMALGISASAFAAPVGVVNVNAILNNYPGITEIAQSVAQEKARLQDEFNKQSANMSDADKQALAQKLNQQLADFEQKKMTPVQKKINKTILSVAKAHDIDSVVNMNAMVAGGKDLTDEVIKALK
ncbi:OmpH family outer membrane protein [uncultured Phascolarctobacterium sp.]|uniref:OmpH family outer membrane protein n=1 Tax=uncultured Phascolarctobacterium sp. TaxID=512296 RepID=UPI0025CC76C0|nr:OmpH family outer membrane protein [uncultured Phascolarctobacterium sp.]